MIVIADNLNTRNKAYMEAVKKGDRKAVSHMAKELAAAGADLINVQCSLDGSGDETALPLAVEAVTGAADVGVCLDSRNVDAIKRSLPLCKKPPLINFISATEPDRAEARSFRPWLAGGQSRAYPYLEAADIDEALRYAAEAVRERELPLTTGR